LLHELIGVKMLMSIENLFNQKLPLVRVPQPFACKILLESLSGRHRDRDCFK
jgi:hypothetical protein